MAHGVAHTKAEIMSGAISTAELLAQQHQPRGGIVHVVILAGVAVTALVIIGVNRWRRRRSRADQHSSSRDRSDESPRSKEPK